jgi:bacterioferritin-associated ferredoxin
MGLSDGKVRDLIRQGWNSLPLLQEATGIGTDCGDCFPELLRLLAEELPEDAAAPTDRPHPKQA